MRSPFKSIAIHSGIFGFAEIMRKGIGFLMIPVYTHYIHPEGYGLLELFDVFMTIAGLLVGLRLGSAIIKYIHHYDNEVDKSEVYTTALIVSVLLSLSIFFCVWLYSSSLADLLTGDASHANLMVIVVASLALQNIYLTGEAKLLAQKRSALYSLMSIITLVTNLSLNIFFIVILNYGVYGILLGMLIAKMLNTLMVYVTTLRGIKLRFSSTKFREMFQFSLPLVPAAVGLFVMHFCDRFFIKQFCSLEDLGIYSLAYKFGMIISVLIIAPIFNTWNTQRFEIAKTGGANEVFGRVFTYFLAILIFAGLGISLFIDETLQLVAPVSYHSAAEIVPLIVLSYVMYGIAGFFTLGNMLSGNTRPVGIVQTTTAMINIALNYFLIASFGIVGAAIATFCSFSCLAVLSYLISQKEYRVTVEWRRLMLLFMVGFTLYGISALLSQTWAVNLVLKALLLASFPILLLLNSFFTTEEVSEIRRLSSMLVSRVGAREGSRT